MSNIDQILSDEQKFYEVTKGAFDQLDIDASGQIDKNDLKGAMVEAATRARINPPPDVQVDEAIKAQDKYFSGAVDFEQFREFVKQLFISLK
mmetsp:Transcript_13014/g.18979  ORF Transcript_13014/g.18979 Transcript_13014/m.18979 type:complete len:92 (+) Transcript_13014:68-343(+)|eukprot:CAMPEP_0202439248 /NCGR_PEP_ID=MMETSP1345-20130828/36063_1 /ASSEMBLY_ACC=CAM_ASM_000843 /TAXON_ID=342563 /ORGANISM="Fabrea Fabrea salina" /LENGTH=91 /DNA_ID=CAMNT_0049053769 /DNA_START=43 /DNA_END=318 /DNA_ORIENTATION=-